MAEPAAKKRRLGSHDAHAPAVPGFAQWNLEQAYEQRPRASKRKPTAEKLPVRTAEGWQPSTQEANEEEAEEEEAAAASGDEDETDSGVASLRPNSTAPAPVPPAARLPPQQQIRQAQEDLAKIAGRISENPEEHVAQLGHLAEMAQSSENVTVRKLALGTQLAVYKDIIPGYRIRPLSAGEMQGKLSKDVRKLRQFEQTLLGSYREYVKMLETLAAGGGELSGIAVSCATALLGSVPHFNFRSELLGIVVGKVASRANSPAAQKCRDALEQLFQDDEEGHASLEAVRELTKMMKSKNYQVHESVLNTFLHLRLLSEFAHKASANSVDRDEPKDGGRNGKKASKKQREFRTKRERKRLREQKQVEKEMKEADAVVSYEERDRNQAETLKLVFVAYFRILKARVPHLMGAVLEGLAKYSHLINQDFFGDVLEALKDLIRDAHASLEADEDADADSDADADLLSTPRNATRESLLCVITAFALLQGQQDVAKAAGGLHLDLSFFVTHLYRTLLPLGLDPEIELSAKTAHLQDPNGLPLPVAKDTRVNVATTAVLLVRSLQAVLLPPTATRAVPPVRVAAFAKQLLTTALHLPPKSTTAVLGLLQQVAKAHGAKIAALWDTEERKGDGVFDALAAEVESSNPFAATVWEGELLRLHFDPHVRDGVKEMERNILDSRS